MKRHRTTLCTLALLVDGLVLLPSTALASGPLLSGYGGPGTGAQAIIGATLLNGPGGGSSGRAPGSPGGGSGSSSGGSASLASGSGNSGGSSSRSSSEVGGAPAHTVSASGRGGDGRVVGRQRHGAGASTQLADAPSNTGFASTGAGGVETSWFSGSDLLALALAAGVLALTAVATAMLAGTRHD